ncbi:MAG: DUF1501 domain-containing protein [Planctomycetota bacterium]
MTDQMKKSSGSNDVTRRSFLGAGGAVAALAATPWWMRKASASPRGGNSRDVFVHVFLRGGMDGLTTCVPYGDPDLYLARPTLAIPQPGQSNGALDLDGFFGLPPAAAPLLTPWANGHLAFVHASGSTDPTRSHFESMRFMEAGIPNQPAFSIDSGWLARHLQTSAPLGNGLLRAVNVSDVLPQSLAKAPATVSARELSTFEFPGNPISLSLRRSTLERMYSRGPEPVRSAASSSLATIDLLQSVDYDGYQPANGAVYPEAELGGALRQTAATIKADLGIEVFMMEMGGWDLHEGLGPIDGTMAGLLGALSSSLEAFYLDMFADIDRVTVLLFSEFGRRVAENGSEGIDHGHGNVMIAMGGHIAGGQVMRQWPGLAPQNLDNGDLAITIDYRDIVAEIVSQRLGNQNLSEIFPNYTPTFQGITV